MRQDASLENTVTRIALVRHGRTEWNAEKRIQGQHDSALTIEGREQALAWGTRLKAFNWSRIIASDLGRARHTADLINKTLNLPVSCDARLRELDWGDWIGMTVSDIKSQYPDMLRRQVAAGWQFRAPGGESREQLWKRAQNALDDIAAQFKGETLLIVTHNGLIKAVLYRLRQRRFLPGEPPLIKPLHLHWLRHDADGLGIEAINALGLNTTGKNAHEHQIFP